MMAVFSVSSARDPHNGHISDSISRTEISFFIFTGLLFFSVCIAVCHFTNFRIFLVCYLENLLHYNIYTVRDTTGFLRTGNLPPDDQKT
jgi:hypothetical protein